MQPRANVVRLSHRRRRRHEAPGALPEEPEERETIDRRWYEFADSRASESIPARSRSASDVPESATVARVSEEAIARPTTSFARRIIASAQTRFASTIARQIWES
jgi:hypothetical protein